MGELDRKFFLLLFWEGVGGLLIGVPLACLLVYNFPCGQIVAGLIGIIFACVGMVIGVKIGKYLGWSV